ncbi:MAG: hypothetical protein HKN51_10925 [Saprospiraceae bacterium]|nr:hypothetical protein [Saprospiraceae bacterium]
MFKLFKAAAFLCAIFIFSNCSQSETLNEQENIQNSLNELSKSTTYTCPSLSNPFDTYGELHNSGLSTFYNSTIAIGVNTNTDYKTAFESVGFYGYQGNQALIDAVVGNITYKDFII